MHILVTGGAGYIGSNVVKALITTGYQVTILDNLSSGSRDNLLPQAEFIYGDICHIPSLQRACKKQIDAIIHLAAQKSVAHSMKDPSSYADTNIIGSIHLINQMVNYNIRFIVFSSSAAVYGIPHYIPIDETHPTHPTNFYGFTKLTIEQLLEWYSSRKEILVASLRYFNAAGQDPEGSPPGIERNSNNLLPVILQVAIGIRSQLEIFGDDFKTTDGTGVRDYIHVSDLAQAHVKALEYLVKEKKNITVNLGTEKGISVKEMLHIARDITHSTIPATVRPRREGDPASLIACSKHAYTLLKWKPQFTDTAFIIKSAWSQWMALQKK